MANRNGENVGGGFAAQFDTDIPTIVERLKREPTAEQEAPAPDLLAELEPAPDEAILLRLAADEVGLHTQLRELELTLAKKLLATMDDSKSALAMSRVLKQVVEVDGAVTRKIRAALLGASTLRARRHFLGQGACTDDV